MRDFMTFVFVTTMTIYLISMVVWVIRVRDLGRRLRHFRLSPGAFTTPPLAPLWPFVMLCVAFAASEAAKDRGGGVLTFGFAGLAVIGCLFAWGRANVILTPDGIAWGVWIFRRQVGWDELDPAGPAWTRLGGSNLRLYLRGGRRRWLSTLFDLHPLLLVNAIRWYAAHPEHRAAIGTEAEHTRLLYALGVVQAR